MKKILNLFILFLSLTANCQGNKLSIEYKNDNLKEALIKLEKKSDYSFFYIDQWLDTESEKFNINFIEKDITDILNNLLESTNLNYFILEKRIIITKNVLISDSHLKKDFFRKEINNESKKTTPKIIVQEPKTYTLHKQLIKIGKQTQNSQNYFNIKGQVLNTSTNKPIKDVVVTLSNKENYTTTDINGLYELLVPFGRNEINFQLLGFEKKTQQVIIYNTGELNIYLKESNDRLDEVVIDGSINKSVRDLAIGVNTIKAEEIKNIPRLLGERDALKVTTTLPGISTATEASSGFNVRGGKAGQNLFLLDNATIYNPTHFFGIFSAVNPFIVNDIKVHKGYIPSELGGRVSSIFEINSKDGFNDKNLGQASIGPITTSFSLNLPISKNKTNIQVAGRTTYSNWLLRAIDNEDLNKSSASFYDVFSKISHKFNDNHDIKSTFYLSNDSYRIASDSLNKYNNRLLSLEWNYKISKKHQLKTTIYNSDYQFEIDFDGKNNNDFDFKYGINETGLKLNNSFNHSKKHKINFGVEAKLYTVKPGKIKPSSSSSTIINKEIPKEKGLEYSLFFSDQYKFSEKLSFNLGLRQTFFSPLGPSEQRIYQEGVPINSSSLSNTQSFENNEFITTFNGLEYRLGLRYLLNDSFSIKSSITKNQQFIHRLTNNTTASPIDTWKLSDLNITPQKATQYSVGFFKNFGENYETSIETYFKSTQDVLDYKVGGTLSLNDAIETEILQGKGKSYGIELFIKKKKGVLNGWLSYTYSRSFLQFNSKFDEETINNGKLFPSNFDKPHDLSLVLNYKLTKRYSLSSNFIYQTGRPITYPIGNFNFNGNQSVFFSERNKFRVPDYFRLDLGINIEGNHKLNKIGHSYWNISVYNLLGRNNPFSIFFINDQGQIKAFKSSIFATPIPTITYNFTF